MTAAENGPADSVADYLGSPGISPLFLQGDARDVLRDGIANHRKRDFKRARQGRRSTKA